MPADEASELYKIVFDNPQTIGICLLALKLRAIFTCKFWMVIKKACHPVVAQRERILACPLSFKMLSHIANKVKSWWEATVIIIIATLDNGLFLAYGQSLLIFVSSLLIFVSSLAALAYTRELVIKCGTGNPKQLYCCCNSPMKPTLNRLECLFDLLFSGIRLSWSCLSHGVFV
jgi:hypothetical protein